MILSTLNRTIGRRWFGYGPKQASLFEPLSWSQSVIDHYQRELAQQTVDAVGRELLKSVRPRVVGARSCSVPTVGRSESGE